MNDIIDGKDITEIGVPAAAIDDLFEPWDALDSAIERLLVSTRTNAGAPPLVAAVVAARDALRSPVYAVMRAYQAEIAEAERLLARAEELAELRPLEQVFVVPGPSISLNGKAIRTAPACGLGRCFTSALTTVWKASRRSDPTATISSGIVGYSTAPPGCPRAAAHTKLCLAPTYGVGQQILASPISGSGQRDLSA